MFAETHRRIIILANTSAPIPYEGYEQNEWEKQYGWENRHLRQEEDGGAVIYNIKDFYGLQMKEDIFSITQQAVTLLELAHQRSPYPLLFSKGIALLLKHGVKDIDDVAARDIITALDGAIEATRAHWLKRVPEQRKRNRSTHLGAVRRNMQLLTPYFGENEEGLFSLESTFLSLSPPAEERNIVNA